MKRNEFGLIAIRVVAVALVVGAFWWVAFDVRWHYHTEALCAVHATTRAECVESWHYMPYVAAAFALLFAAGILNQKVAKGAADVVLPFYNGAMARLGRRDTDPVVPVAVVPDTHAPAPTPIDPSVDAPDKTH
jgi:hypothetical protein